MSSHGKSGRAVGVGVPGKVGDRYVGAMMGPTPAQTLETFEISRDIIINKCIKYAYCVYGQFLELDDLLDEFEEKVRAVQYEGRTRGQA